MNKSEYFSISFLKYMPGALLNLLFLNMALIMRSLLLLCFSIFGYFSFAQNTTNVTPERCITGSVMDKFFKDHPLKKAAFDQRQIEFQKRYELVRRQHRGFPVQQRISTTITIPVVVHIVLSDPSIVTDDQVQSQIDVLNADYAGMNADSVKIPAAFKPVFGKGQLRFCLAQRTPQNNPTNGIIRLSSNTTSVPGEGDPVKHASQGGADVWDVTKYLNIWVCKMSNSTDLGYTFMPGLGIDPSELGFVNAYHAFGTTGTATAPFNKGRTATHEIGHYFNLQHIWGANSCDVSSCADSDNVDDTPNQDKCFFGIPAFPTTDACTTVSPGVMFMNFMDYTDDATMCLFTQGQADRMETALTSFPELIPLLSSDGCTPPALYSNDAEAQKAINPANNIIYCSGTFIPQLQIRNIASQPLNSVRLNVSIDNGAVTSSNINLSLPSLATTTLTGDAINITPGNHTIKMFTSLPNGVTDQRPENDTVSTIFSVIGTSAAPITEGFENNSFPPAGWGIGNNSDLVEYNPTRVANAAHSGTASLKFDNHNYQLFGKYALLSSPKINIPINADSVKITFWRAAAQATSNVADTLQILFSVDCGQTFISAYKKGGASLRTTETLTTSDYIPAANEWVADTADLTSYVAGKYDNLIVQFRNINGFGNNVYLDDINIKTITLPPVLKDKGYLLAPNPTAGNLILQHYPTASMLKGIAVYNSIGQLVWKDDYGKTPAMTSIHINLSNTAPGIYFVRLLYTNKVITEKILKIN